MLYEESPPQTNVREGGADGMSPRGLPHMYSASLYNIGRDCMEIHAASPDVPFNRGGCIFAIAQGGVVEADHVTAPGYEHCGARQPWGECQDTASYTAHCVRIPVARPAAPVIVAHSCSRHMLRWRTVCSESMRRASLAYRH